MKSGSDNQGSTLVMALLACLTLSYIAWTVFYAVGSRHQAMFQSGSWQEALNVAESGADTALNALNTGTWTGWSAASGAFPTTYTSLTSHTGDGNNRMYFSVTVTNNLSDASGTWYTINSTGTTELPGPKRVGPERSILSSAGTKNHLGLLRKLSFNTNVAPGKLNLPQTTRSIQVVAQPLTTSPFTKAFITQNGITMSGGAYTDSFDSTNPLMSTNGQYDPTKRQKHGDIASNTSGNNSNLQSSYVYGNASSNSGTIQNTQNVQGTVYNNFSTTLTQPKDPTWASYTSASINNPNAPVTFTAGTQAAPANYKLSALTLSNSANPLILAAPTAGQTSYINIWVTGDLTTNGSGFIQQNAGVHATFYVDGNVNVTGSAIDNVNGLASYLTIYGTAPASANDKYTVSGSANFIGVVDAPGLALTISGSGNFMGALIMNNATISGAAGFHYDQSLAGASGGTGLGFKVASWVEDVNPQNFQ